MKVKKVKKSVSLPDDLLAAAERRAAQDGRSLSNFVTMAVRREVEGARPVKEPEPALEGVN